LATLQKPEERRVPVEGAPEADRLMVVDLTALCAELSKIGEPTEEDLGPYLAGASLLAALNNESMDFGAAAPGATEDDDLAGRILELTDEAFAAAHDLICAAAGERDGLPDDFSASSRLLRAFALAGSEELFHSVWRGFEGAPATPDPVVAKELV
jgi:hypothetical protein